MEDKTTVETISPETNGQSDTDPKPTLRPKGRPKGTIRKAKATSAVPKAKSAKSAKGRNTPIQDVLKYRDAAVVLKQAADGTRLHILFTLDQGEKNVGEICTAVGQASQPAVSHHLAICRFGGIVQVRRSGKNSIYSLTEKGKKLANALRPLVQS